MDVSKIITLLGGLITMLQMVGGGIAFLFLCWGALQIATAGIKYDQATKGKETMVMAAVGLGLLLIGGTIVRLILTSMGADAIPIPTSIGGN